MLPKIMRNKRKSEGGDKSTWWRAFVTAFWSKGRQKKKNGRNVLDPPTTSPHDNSENLEPINGGTFRPIRSRIRITCRLVASGQLVEIKTHDYLHITLECILRVLSLSLSLYYKKCWPCRYWLFNEGVFIPHQNLKTFSESTNQIRCTCSTFINKT